MSKVNLQADLVIHMLILVNCNIYDDWCHKCFLIPPLYALSDTSQRHTNKNQLLCGYLHNSFCLISSLPTMYFRLQQFYFQAI